MVNNFINGKKYSWTVHSCKDDIAVRTFDYSFFNFLRCMSQSRQIKQNIKFFLKKLEMESQLMTYNENNEKLFIMYLSVSK